MDLTQAQYASSVQDSAYVFRAPSQRTASLSNTYQSQSQNPFRVPSIAPTTGSNSTWEIKSPFVAPLELPQGPTLGQTQAHPIQTWPATKQHSHGIRTEPHLPRGIVSSAGPDADSHWKAAIKVITRYEFQNPDLLEEALESPGSGVTCIGSGETHRHFLDGNRGLASVGDSVMKMVLKDQCYLFKIPEGEASKIINSLVSMRNLDRLGRTSRIEKFVRPMMPMRPAKKRNVFSLLKDDMAREDPSRTIARAMRAIAGAVYYDGQLAAVRRVMAELELIIKLPES